MKNVPAELMRLESAKKQVEIAKDAYKELHDKIADLQLANQCLRVKDSKECQEL